MVTTPALDGVELSPLLRGDPHLPVVKSPTSLTPPTIQIPQRQGRQRHPELALKGNKEGLGTCMNPLTQWDAGLAGSYQPCPPPPSGWPQSFFHNTASDHQNKERRNDHPTLLQHQNTTRAAGPRSPEPEADVPKPVLHGSSLLPHLYPFLSDEVCTCHSNTWEME